jgi:hydroxymethylpyrimidine pyrophosphatase-like HAD family hydrolase
MFEGCGTSAAMGNGEKLIPYADYVTADLRHDGIAQAMEHFGFFEP